MSVAQDLLSEMHTWRAAWRQIEIFLERIDEMRDKDAPHAARTKALLRVIAFIQCESKCRTGQGYDLPFEMAVAGEGPPDIEEGGGFPDPTGPSYRYPRFEDIDAAQLVQKDTLKSRLPGLLEIEVAAAPLALPPYSNFSESDIKAVSLSDSHTLFTRYDVDSKSWVPVRLPDYSFGEVPSSILVDIVDRGLFKRDARRDIIGESLRTDISPPSEDAGRSENLPKLWRGYRDDGKNPSQLASNTPLNTSRTTTTLKILLKVCQKGRDAAREAREIIQEEGVGPAAYVDDETIEHILELVETGFIQRATLYQKMLQGSDPATDNENALLMTQVIDLIGQAFLEAVLEESVEAQIAYPDGTLRQLRTLEWTFLMHYNARLPWFWYRRERALKPLLTRFLRAFHKSLVKLRADGVTTFPYSFSLNRTAAVGDASVQLVPPDREPFHDLGKITPGQIAILQGRKPQRVSQATPAAPAALRAAPVKPEERSTAVLILGVDTPLRLNGKVVQRLRVSPIRVSLATGKDVPGSAGLIPAGGSLDSGPVDLSDDLLLAGTDSAYPANDGILQEIVSVWSKLCLFLGIQTVEAKGINLPSPLPRTTHVPIMGSVKPATDRVIVRVRDLVALGFDPKKPHFARPGEMLLLRGRAGAEDDGSPGDLWQTAVEVRGVVRITPDQINDDLSVMTLPCPLCCEGPGELLAVLISDPKIPVELMSAFLHRDFLGFGTPSLSSEHILPVVIDPDSSTLSDTVYRGPELDVAVSILKHWLGDRTAP